MTTSQGQLVAFNARSEPEKIQGKPKFVQVERVDYLSDTDQISGRRRLQETITYQTTGRISERTSHSSDGSLCYRFTYEYALDGRLVETKTLDATGKEWQKSSFSVDGDVQEEVVTTPDRILDRKRTMQKFDANGRIMEVTSKSLLRGSQIRQQFEYNSNGEITREKIVLEGPSQGIARIETVRQPYDRMVAVSYSPDGRIVAKAESYADETRSESSQTIYAGDTTYMKTTTEEIVFRDEVGNWTQKTIREDTGKPPGAESTAVLYRTITYY